MKPTADGEGYGSAVGTDGVVSRKRRVAAWILLIVAVVLTPVTIATRWVNFQVTDEDRFVASLGPLADDPEVQEAVADRVTQLIFDNVDVAELAQDALPDRAAFLAAPLAAGVESFTNEQALKFTQSEQFSELWHQALVVAHQAMDALLTGKDDGAIRVDDGEVVLDLTTVVQGVVDRLSDRGLTFVESLPTSAISGEIVLFQSQALADAQAGVELLNTLSWVLLAVGLASYAGSVVLLGDARRGFVRVGTGLAVGGLLLGVMLATGRGLYLDAAVSLGGDRTVQSIVFSHVFASLRNTLRTIAVLGLVIGVASWLLGPSRPATWVRGLLSGGLGKTAEGAGAVGMGDQGVLRWLGRHERKVQGGLLVLVAALFLFWTQPTPKTVLVIALVTVVVLAVVSVLARAGRAAAVAAPSDAGGAPSPAEEEDALVGADVVAGSPAKGTIEAGAASDADQASDPADEGEVTP